MKRIFRKAIVYFTVLAVLISNVSISSVKLWKKRRNHVYAVIMDDSTGEKDNAKL
ncbi:MAG: hypothetical protein ACLTY6_11560 [Clostridium perfringens]